MESQLQLHIDYPLLELRVGFRKVAYNILLAKEGLYSDTYRMQAFADS